MTAAAVILAAGGGSRFTGRTHKLAADFRGRPLVTWPVEACRSTGFAETIVVQGAVDLSGVLPQDVTLLTNLRWVDGQATSLGLAITYARSRGHDRVVVGLGDQPLVPRSAWIAVGVAAGGRPITVATYGGRRGHPVGLGASVWDRLSFEGDEGARELMRREPGLCGEVACEGNPADVDTVEDLAQWS